MLQLLERLQNPAITTSGDLAFVKDWQFFTSEPMADFEQLTRSGPYAGTLTAFTTGVRMRTRYNNLLEHHFSSVNKKLHLWASDSARVVETAKYFAARLLGLDWEDIAVLIVIPETAERGGNTLTPGDTCIRYLSDLKLGHNQGYKRLAAFTDTYLPIVATRLEGFIHNQVSKIPFKLSKSEVYAMQEMCGFEIMARGSSPWCNVFSQDEWRQFAYARDILHYYRAGPGTPYSVSIGGLYLNATARLLLQGPEAGSLFFSL
jgi:acid phosphatase